MSRQVSQAWRQVAVRARGCRSCSSAIAHDTEPRFRQFRPKKIAVLGSGSFGTALATCLARNGHEVVILSRRESVAESITKTHRNPDYLVDFPLPFNVAATTDPARALANASFVLHAVPVQASAEYLEALQDYIPPDLPIISSSKGLHTSTLKMMNHVIPDALGNPDQPFAAFSGPTFAKELLAGYPSGAVVASENQNLAKHVAGLFDSPTLRVYTTDDVVGVEVGGALKNVYAIAAGCVQGLGLGLNTTALLVTRAVAEMNGIALALGSTQPTLVGLAGWGDLVLTCFGELSRNRTVGARIGAGEKLADILATQREVPEGVATTPAVVKLAHELGVEAPIAEAVHEVLHFGCSPVEAMLGLLNVPAGQEAIISYNDGSESDK